MYIPSNDVSTPLGRAPYQALFCEENAWQIARMARDAALPARVLFVTNERKSAALLAQRAGVGPESLVVWDYHALTIVERDECWEAWDPDSTLGLPVSLEHYVRESFCGIEAWASRFVPKVRVVDADALLEGFSSTREHMRDDQGLWRAPPPAWPPILGRGGAFALSALLDTRDDRAGPWLTPRALVDFVRRSAARA
jgi:hypothetical protein